MKRSKAEKDVIANYISDLLATHEFVAFTRTPLGTQDKKQLNKFNTKAINRLTTKEQQHGRKHVR